MILLHIAILQNVDRRVPSPSNHPFPCLSPLSSTASCSILFGFHLTPRYRGWSLGIRRATKCCTDEGGRLRGKLGMAGRGVKVGEWAMRSGACPCCAPYRVARWDERPPGTFLRRATNYSDDGFWACEEAKKHWYCWSQGEIREHVGLPWTAGFIVFSCYFLFCLFFCQQSR